MAFNDTISGQLDEMLAPLPSNPASVSYKLAVNYNQMLRQKLNPDEVEELKFLLCDDQYAPKGIIVCCRNLLELIMAFRNAGLQEEETLHLIREGLYFINRHDILRNTGKKKKFFRHIKFGEHIRGGRVLTYRALEQLDQPNTDSLRRNLLLTRQIRLKEGSAEPTLYELILLLEERDKLILDDPDAVHGLISSVLNDNPTLRQSVLKVLSDFKRERETQLSLGQSAELPPAQSPRPAAATRTELTRTISAGGVGICEALENNRNLFRCVQGPENPEASENVVTALVRGDFDTKPIFSAIDQSGNSTVLPEMTLDDFYPMNRNPRGLCIIINNENFTARDFGNRNGTDVDGRILKETFGDNLNFKVYESNDCTAEAIETIMKFYAGENHSEYDCFVGIILSHGTLDYVYGVDGSRVKIRTITNMFNANNCRSLRGKPKLFFLQACQGDEALEAVESDGPRRNQSPIATDLDDEVDEDLESDGRESISCEADFLYGMSTTPGYVSFRSKTRGSWYISALCENINKYYERHDILRILTKVNSDVSKQVAKLQGQIQKQMPSPIYTLRKLCYLGDTTHLRV